MEAILITVCIAAAVAGGWWWSIKNHKGEVFWLHDGTRVYVKEGIVYNEDGTTVRDRATIEEVRKIWIHRRNYPGGGGDPPTIIAGVGGC